MDAISKTILVNLIKSRGLSCNENRCSICHSILIYKCTNTKLDRVDLTRYDTAVELLAEEDSTLLMELLL